MTLADPTAFDPTATAAPPAFAGAELPFEDVIRVHNHFHDELIAGWIDSDRKSITQHVA